MKLAREIEYYSLVWYKGKIYKLVAGNSMSRYFMRVDDNGSYVGDEALQVSVNTPVELLASETFEVGQEVVSTIGGLRPFIGYVVGFDKEHNHVICKPANVNTHNHRVRFAYKPHEITARDANETEQIKICIHCGGIR